MFPSSHFDPAPAAVRALRHGARLAILWLLWAGAPGLGWLAWRGGMGWELVTLLGLVAALAASLGGHASVPARRGRLLLGLGIAVTTGLLLGAGRVTLPGWLGVAAPLAALALAGGLGDARALLGAWAVLMLACLLPLAAPVPAGLAVIQAGGLALAAPAILVAQRLLRRAALGRVPCHHGRGAELRPPPPPSWSAAVPPAPAPRVLVQAERAPDGTLRMALAAREPGRLRVTVC